MSRVSARGTVNGTMLLEYSPRVPVWAVGALALTMSVVSLGGQGPGDGPIDADDLAPASCAVTTPVAAQAPPDPNADPVRGYWHRSADLKLWVPSPAPRQWTTGIGRYFVRPAGTPLRFVLRRLDASAPAIDIVEDGYASAGFYFGGPPLPTDGCWEATVSAGESRVTFVTAIRDTIERFVGHPDTRVAWSRESGRIAGGDASVTVAAVVLERPGSFTGRLRGARVELSSPAGTVTLYEERARLIGTGATLDRIATSGGTMIYGLGRIFNVRANEQALAFVGQGRQVDLPGRSSRDFAALLVRARQDLESALR
jgi:hypothetical protein